MKGIARILFRVRLVDLFILGFENAVKLTVLVMLEGVLEQAHGCQPERFRVGVGRAGFAED